MSFTARPQHEAPAQQDRQDLEDKDLNAPEVDNELGMGMIDLSSILRDFPEVHGNIASYIWSGHHKEMKQGLIQMRHTSKTVRDHMLTTQLGGWYKQFQWPIGCACGHCKEWWLRCGWICEKRQLL